MRGTASASVDSHLRDHIGIWIVYPGTRHTGGRNVSFLRSLQPAWQLNNSHVRTHCLIPGECTAAALPVTVLPERHFSRHPRTVLPFLCSITVRTTFGQVALDHRKSHCAGDNRSTIASPPRLNSTSSRVLASGRLHPDCPANWLPG